MVWRDSVICPTFQSLHKLPPRITSCVILRFVFMLAKNQSMYYYATVVAHLRKQLHAYSGEVRFWTK